MLRCVRFSRKLKTRPFSWTRTSNSAASWSLGSTSTSLVICNSLATDDPMVIEIKSLAVDPEHRGAGIGRALVAAAIARCADEGFARIVLSTATADVGNLRFYQRMGFRFESIERDAFTPATGYPVPIDIDGVALRDRIWLDLDLPTSAV